MPRIDEIRENVGDIGLGEAAIQQFGSGNSVSIRTALPDGDKAAAERAGQKLVAGIQNAFPTAKAGSVETVSGKVSEELLRTGAISLALAMLGISIYIWIRFERSEEHTSELQSLMRISYAVFCLKKKTKKKK